MNARQQLPADKLKIDEKGQEAQPCRSTKSVFGVETQKWIEWWVEDAEIWVPRVWAHGSRASTWDGMKR
jgi:hypothetical protein